MGVTEKAMARNGGAPPGKTKAEWSALCAQDAEWNRERKETQDRHASEAARRVLEMTYFRTSHEGGYLADEDHLAPALVFNPNAEPVAFAAAAASRADTLHRTLVSWSIAEPEEVTVGEVAAALEPLAQEVKLLLDHLMTQLDNSPKATGEPVKSQ